MIVGALLLGILLSAECTDQGRLVAVTEAVRERSWTPHGRPLKNWIFPDMMKAMKDPLARDPKPIFIIRIDGRRSTDPPSVAFKFPGSPQQGNGFVLIQNDDRTWMAGTSHQFSSEVTESYLSYGLARGPWRRAITFYPNLGVWKNGFWGPQLRDRGPAKLTKPPASGVSVSTFSVVSVKLQIPENLRPYAIRVQAYDLKGHALEGSGSIDDRKSRTLDAWFHGRKSNVSRIELQTRPYRWTQLKHVRLKPIE